MSLHFRLRKNMWLASAVLGNTEAHAQVGSLGCDAAAAAAAETAETGMSMRMSLVCEEGFGCAVWVLDS